MKLPPKREPLGGQAITEVVLLLPLLMFMLFAFSKIFASLVLVQKMEIASFYAARRWQLESHRNVAHEGFDSGQLCLNIETNVKDYLGFNNNAAKSFLGLQNAKVCPVTRTQVWNVVTLTVNTRPIRTPVFKFKSLTYEVTKYVPNRDRPIAFVLPGLQP